jgi:hypothetical protein
VTMVPPRIKSDMAVDLPLRDRGDCSAMAHIMKLIDWSNSIAGGRHHPEVRRP